MRLIGHYRAKHMKEQLRYRIHGIPTHQAKLAEEEWPILKLVKSIFQVVEGRSWCKEYRVNPSVMSL